MEKYYMVILILVYIRKYIYGLWEWDGVGLGYF